MVEEAKNFYERQMAVREEFDPYLNLAEIKRILNISYKEIISLIRTGALPAIKVGGEPVVREQVTLETKQLRVLPSDLRAYIDSRAV